MNTLQLSDEELALQQAQHDRSQPVGHILMERGQVTAQDVVQVMAEARRIGQPITHVMAADGLATREEILAAQARHYGALVLRREVTPPDSDVVALLPPDFCLTHGILPWARIGDRLMVATSRPDQFDSIRQRFPDALQGALMALTLEADIHEEIAAQYGATFAKEAETCVPSAESCRDLNTSTPMSLAIAGVLAAGALALFVYAPLVLFGLGLTLAIGSLLLAQGLKLVALFASSKPKRAAVPRLPDTLPTVSVLIPLFRESEIAAKLIQRLSRLTYPKACLDIILVLEAEDTQTRALLKRTQLPSWMRVISVPPGEVTTKPRAMNYALRFTRGDYIGIYDAEDAPAPDQIERVVDHFTHAPDDVGCIQGILDFYNPRANWLSRCFAIEYASWFRILLPGLARIGFAVPLGGTTVFFRRKALLATRGWDAHNVTEDADLGIRLARHGFRTELFASVTREEANNRFWPWIKQRSRWLKGYGLTWWVHSRRPLKLLRDLGPKRFLGVQLLFLTTLVQFALAPVLWSFWLIVAGLPHPLDPYLDRPTMIALTTLFLSAEAIGIFVSLAAVSRTPHSGLFAWVPTQFAYFPLGTIAIYKAFWETLTNPFYWDKTQHGHSAPDTLEAELHLDE
jgi:cellulose synthase/poly-beta-1,6-N-acetylglucosamine synthase-like glycosyltransferase